MIALLRQRLPRWRPESIYVISHSKPFFESGSGRYSHRVRSAALHSICGKSHIAVECWCGAHFCISPRNRGSGFVAEPSMARPICATCEGRAIGAGQVGSREIAGRAVMFTPRNAA